MTSLLGFVANRNKGLKNPSSYEQEITQELTLKYIDLFKEKISPSIPEDKAGLYFNLLLKALATKSACRPYGKCEKLALLGGAITKLIVSQYVFSLSIK